MNKKRILIICLFIIILLIAMFLIIKFTDKNESYEVTLDWLYTSEITADYEDIRELPLSYSKESAQKDKCFVIGAMVHNDYLYREFMGKYEKKENAFVRVAQNTIEGDLIIYDIYYDSQKNKVYVVSDYTRDEFAAEEDKTINLTEYDSVSEYKYNDRLYWVVYKGELDDNTFNTTNVKIITTIN